MEKTFRWINVNKYFQFNNYEVEVEVFEDFVFLAVENRDDRITVNFTKEEFETFKNFINELE